ncbi:MAG: DUF790 family protein [Myxococcales bacterium]|nr:DUF790 family protein [Myxococcales bacterium]
MLTSDLVRFRKKAGRVTPRYLNAAARERLLPVAAELVATYQAAVGGTLGDLDDAAQAVGHEARDRLVVQGLKKLCDDRTVIDRPAGLDPVATRAEVFGRAARAHRAAGQAGFDRAAVLTEAAATLGTTVDEIERALFSDLRAAQVVSGFEPVEPAELLAEYDLALAQAALFRASRVVVTVERADAPEVRALFRAARFHGLLFEAKQRDVGYEVTFDGPFSLFDSVQRYGLKLAIVLPHILALPRFTMTAELFVGAKKERAEMVLTQDDSVARPHASGEGLRPEIEQLVTAFRALGSSWDIAGCTEILSLPSQAVVVPDLVFSSRLTGEVVYFELMGFWSRDAVFRRIEQIERGLDGRLLLAVSKKLRVSREALDEATGSSLIVFNTALSAKEVLARLDGPSGVLRKS